MDAIIQPSTSKLNENNYHLWKLRTESTLKAKDAWIAIDKPDPGNDEGDAAEKARWDKACYVAMGYMTNVIEDSILGQFINATCAKDLWESLKNKYEANTDIKKIDLRNDIATLKMKNEENWKEYILRATNLGERARAFGMDLSDKEMAYNIVKGLLPRYHILKTSFSVQSTIDIDLLKRALREHDEQNGQKWDRENACKAKVIRNQHYEYGEKLQKRCWHCNKKGHQKSECWILHGKPRTKNDQERFSSKYRKGQPNAKNAEVKRVENVPQPNEELWVVDENCLQDPEETKWILDSGATSHMCSQRHWIQNFTSETGKVKLADDRLANITGKGIIRLQSRETGRDIKLQDVLYVPSLRGNLISVRKVVLLTGNTVDFDKEGAVIYSPDGKRIVSAKLVDNFYELDVDTVTEEANENSFPFKQKGCITEETEIRDSSVGHEPNASAMKTETAKVVVNKQTWHKRLNHLNETAMDKLKNDNMIVGLEYANDKLGICNSCSTGKCTKYPYKSIGHHQSTAILELLHMDLCGPFPVESIEGENYLLTIVDDYSRKIFSSFLKTKDQASEKFENLIRLEENLTGKRVKKIRTDNGGEFIGQSFKQMLHEKGIQHQLTTVYSPASNGIAERANRTIVEAARTILIEAKLPNRFWAEAARTACYTRNACPTKINENDTPQEKYSKKKPNAKHLRVFGCLAYYHVPKEKRSSKLTPTGKIGIFTGYSETRSAYRIFDPEDGKIHEAKHVKFHEDKLGSDLLKHENQNKQDLSYEIVRLQTIGNTRQREDENGETEDEDEGQQFQNEQNQEEVDQERLRNGEPIRRSERIRNQNRIKGAPQYHEISSTDTEDEQEISIVEETQFVEENKETPKNFKEVMTNKYKTQWLAAMQREIDSLKAHGVWNLVKKRKHSKPIPSKWVFKIKRNDDGSIDKFKARLVGVGCTQKRGKNYDKTFSPVVRLESLRTLLALARMKNYKVKFYDVETAYLHGKLDEDITMEQPEGFEEGNPKEIVCQLKQGIYGLKQSGRIWYTTLRDYLLKVGFVQLKFDPCIFRYSTENTEVFIAIYVDDIVAVGTTNEDIQKVIQLIMKKFPLTESKENNKILGWNFKWTSNELLISQESYAREILKRFEMENCKSVSTPLEPGQKLNEYENSPKVDVKLYQEMVGSIMYLMTGTRPDLSFAISALSRFLKDPREIHMRAAKRTLRYIKGTIDKGLVYSNGQGRLAGYADASWNDGNADEKSITGYVTQIGCNTVTWKSKRQTNVSLSTCQSELTAIAECMKELVWLRGLINEIGGEKYVSSPVQIFNDNQAAISSAGEIETYSKIRHYMRNVLYIRQQVQLGNYKLKYVASESLCADALTKAIGPSKLAKCNSDFNLRKL